MKGFTLLETLLYISLLTFILSFSNMLMYSFLQSTTHLESEIKIEKEGMFILQRIEHSLVNNHPLSEIEFTILNNLSDFLVEYIPLSEELTRVDVHFSIKNHYFSLTQYIDYEYSS